MISYRGSDVKMDDHLGFVSVSCIIYVFFLIIILEIRVLCTDCVFVQIALLSFLPCAGPGRCRCVVGPICFLDDGVEGDLNQALVLLGL